MSMEKTTNWQTVCHKILLCQQLLKLIVMMTITVQYPWYSSTVRPQSRAVSSKHIIINNKPSTSLQWKPWCHVKWHTIYSATLYLDYCTQWIILIKKRRCYWESLQMSQSARTSCKMNFWAQIEDLYTCDRLGLKPSFVQKIQQVKLFTSFWAVGQHKPM